MYANTLHILVLSIMFSGTHEDFLGRIRNYYSKKLDVFANMSIATKLKQIGIFDTWGISYMRIEPPRHEAKVVFCNGKELKTGYILSFDYLSKPPNITWPVQENHYYTLYIGDLDSKITLGRNHTNHTKFQANAIWLKSNIPGCNIEKGDDLFHYSPLGRNTQEEIRRHLILVYDQNHPEPHDFEGFANSEKRQDFRVDLFAESFFFDSIPWAANLYFVLDSEDYMDGL